MAYVYKNTSLDLTATTIDFFRSQGAINTIVGELSKNFWYTIYNIDFSKSLDNWDIINKENSLFVQQTENGIEIQSNHNPSEWFNSTRTSPGIVLDVKKIITNKIKPLCNFHNFEVRITAEVSGSKFSHNYEDVSFGLETKNRRNGYNFISVSKYFDYEKQSNLRTSFIKTTNGTSIESDYSAKESNIVVFHIKNHYTVEAYTSTSTDFFSSCNNQFLEKELSHVFLWCEDETSQEKKPIVFDISDINIVFCIGTTYDYRDVFGNIRNLSIQVKPK